MALTMYAEDPFDKIRLQRSRLAPLDHLWISIYLFSLLGRKSILRQKIKQPTKRRLPRPIAFASPLGSRATQPSSSATTSAVSAAPPDSPASKTSRAKAALERDSSSTRSSIVPRATMR